MRLSDHPAASALRATANRSSVPSTLFLQPLEAGLTRIQPITVVMLLQLLLNYIKVSHTNPLVRYSVLRSLWRARQNFSAHMTCAQIPLSSICRAHYTDHSGFLILMHHMDIETHFRASIMEMDDDIPMYKANHSMEANQMHAWLSEGYRTQRKAKRMGWPYVWQYEPPPKSHPNCKPPHTTNTSHHTHTTRASLYHRWIRAPRWTLWRVYSYHMQPHISVHILPSSDPHLFGPFICM